MVNLNRAFELDDGIINNGAVLDSSLAGSIRSSKPSFDSDGKLTSLVYYTSLTQVDANRLALSTFNYTSDENLETISITYYLNDGVTVHSTKTVTVSYDTDESVTNIEEEY